MPAGGETLIAGSYTVTWNSVSVGMMEGDQGCPTLEQNTHAEMVNNTTTYGKSQIDGVYQGADWFAAYTCEEYRTGSIAAFWPYGTFGLMGVIARLLFGLSAPLVLTVVAGTPAVGSPNTVTASKAILAPGFNGRLLYGPTLRKVPIRQVLFPFDTGGGVIGWFTQT